ncbi:MAG TPA: hypothetical protein VG758_09565 [Hyphomicrobiaceae bacterium]|nr:hypothetical protein [Hyphomicrobiaceae bacterium]
MFEGLMVRQVRVAVAVCGLWLSTAAPAAAEDLPAGYTRVDSPVGVVGSSSSDLH